MASAELQQELIGNYINTSANVLFLYDSIVTLCEEIDIIWRRKWTAMTWLFAFTRYVAIVNIILTFTSPGSAQSCAALMFTGDALLLLQYLCLASFSALRVHALLDGRYITAGVVLLLNMIPFAVNMFAFITDTTILDPEVCTEVYSGSASRGLLLSLLSRVSVIVGDVIVLAVTWAKTAQLYREARRLNIEAPLARMLICDGTLYFIILLIINVLDALGENVPILFNLGAVVSFFNILPSLIVCRFILNLRQVEPAGSSSSVSGNQSQSIRFVGNMGQSLQFGAAEEEEEDELEGDNNLTQANTNTLSGGSSTAEKCGATNEIGVVDVRLHSSV